MILYSAIIILAGLTGLLIDKSIFSNLALLSDSYRISAFFIIISIFAIVISILLRRLSKRKVISIFVGLIIGKVLSFTATVIVQGYIKVLPGYLTTIFDLFFIILSVMYLVNIERFASSLNIKSLNFSNKKNKNTIGQYKILDTSVIIDGRISDIVESGFIDGTLIVPQFVLTELQHIADSADQIKRSRGRRGLDILNQMKSSTNCDIKISDSNFNDIAEVDTKLIELAREMKSTIITNDYNLNKVAKINGIKVLNINELSNVLKPVVLPGEEMKVTVIKEGKDPNQGIAYLDDGTMIVVEQGRNFINKEVSVYVTSVFQTPAGRMIFSQPNV